MRSDERGSITLLGIGLFLFTLMFAGLVVDFARLDAADRALATATDAAAAAGANGLDEQHYRSSGEVRLSESAARTLATDAMDAQPEAAALSDFAVAVDPEAVTVSAAMPVELSLLGLVMPGPLEVRASATASPRRAT